MIWQFTEESKLEREFLSDEIVESAQCVVALETIPLLNNNGWLREASKFHNEILHKVLDRNKDEMEKVNNSNLSIASYETAVHMRKTNFMLLALDKARVDAGVFEDQVNTRLLKSWMGSKTCQNTLFLHKATNIISNKIDEFKNLTKQIDSSIDYRPLYKLGYYMPTLYISGGFSGLKNYKELYDSTKLDEEFESLVKIYAEEIIESKTLTLENASKNKIETMLTEQKQFLNELKQLNKNYYGFIKHQVAETTTYQNSKILEENNEQKFLEGYRKLFNLPDVTENTLKHISN